MITNTHICMILNTHTYMSFVPLSICGNGHFQRMSICTCGRVRVCVRLNRGSRTNFSSVFVVCVFDAYHQQVSLQFSSHFFGCIVDHLLSGCNVGVCVCVRLCMCVRASGGGCRRLPERVLS